MIQFTKLRLSGFKSFVDRTEMEIGPGLNGIVGPNGCGKSNLVEALRWVMGESSAKRMRGDGMEDVIFAGTDQRSKRNFAEVSLLLDNSSHQAPSAYNSLDEIEVIRRIERDKGSGYKINGKNARARDVQMLFADTVTGANSPSLVSQGDVTRMINAKPRDRRLVLEESAGIAGLYARRHEAELRLKAADGNLQRVEDVLGGMESRLSSLKRQARQAAKYKTLSAQIRQFELLIAHLEWKALKEKDIEYEREFGQAESAVAERMTTVMQLTKTHETQSQDIPGLRMRVNDLSAALQKVKIEFQRMEEDAQRYSNDVENNKNLITQLQTDKKHESQSLEETLALLSSVEVEQKSLIEEQKREELSEKEKSLNIETLKDAYASSEDRYSVMKDGAAESRARESALSSQINSAQRRIETLQSRLDSVTAEKSSLVLDPNSQKMILDLENKTKEYEALLLSLKEKGEESHQNIVGADTHLSEMRNELSSYEKSYAEFTAEIKMLEKFFDSMDQQDFEPVLDGITTKPGFEKALSRALGDSLNGSLNTQALTHWVDTTSNDNFDLPSGVSSLLPYIDAPQALHNSLSQIGYVKSFDEGESVANNLKQGQSLVSLDGDYWRWDGYRINAKSADLHSVHFEQKNKLIELEKQRQDIEEQLQEKEDAFEEAQAALDEAKEDEKNLRQQVKETEHKLRELRPALQKIKEKNLRTESEQKRCEIQIETIHEDLEAAKASLKNDELRLAELQKALENEHNEEQMNAARTSMEDAREAYQNALREYDLFMQEKRTRTARIQAISDERVSLNNRSIRAKDQLNKIEQREAEAIKKQQSLAKEKPASGSDPQDVLNRISSLEEQHNEASVLLGHAESELADTAKGLKEAEQHLSSEKEKRASIQALCGSLKEQIDQFSSAIVDNFKIPPQELTQHIAVDLVSYEVKDLAKLKSDKESSVRSREQIGAVNLRAEEEAEELEKELTTLLHERNDLIQAIEELRGAINKINKEARERLTIAFDHVNAHFKHLFGRLFRGGKAHLELIDSEDPLGAGLEIFAQPPGKSLQSLSLLSGGEQTLASIALIFAMFLTNPSPICVLDEIDAPLDDANVDRVCDLLEEIAERGETRFLVITHHRLSMARMDRLYGVTMHEKGVSQLVSVDMQQSFSFAEQQVA